MVWPTGKCVLVAEVYSHSGRQYFPCEVDVNVAKLSMVVNGNTSLSMNVKSRRSRLYAKSRVRDSGLRNLVPLKVSINDIH